MKIKNHLKAWGFALCCLSAASTAYAQKTRKVLLIGIDGCVNACFSATNTPNLQNLINTSYYAKNALNENPTISAPNWSTILTGTKVAKHGVTSNSWGTTSALLTYRSFFDAVKNQSPTKRTASVVTYSDLNQGYPASANAQILRDDDLNYKYVSQDSQGRDYNDSGVNEVQSDADTKAKVVAELTNNNPDAIFCHFDNADHTGHGTGFYDPNQPATTTSNAAYINAVKAIDVHVGSIVAAVKARANYTNEDWLIAITTDHGGTGFSHGGTSYIERNSFVILNGSGISPTLLNDLPVNKNAFSGSVANFATGKYGTLPASISSLDLANSFTIQLRVKRGSGNGTDPAIISNKNWDSGNNTGFVLYDLNGKLGVNIGNGTTRTDLPAMGTGLLSIDDGKWHYVTLVVNRTGGTGTLSLYDSEKLIATKTISFTGTLASGNAIKIAQAYATGGGNYGLNYNGNITDIRLFNTALSQSAIAANIYNNNLSTSTANLVYYAKGHDGSGSAYVASVGGNVALTGSPTWSTVTADIAKTASATAPLFGTAGATLANLGSTAPGSINLASGNFTIELAVKRSSGTSDPAILANKNWNSGINAGLAIVDNSGTLKINMGDGTDRADMVGPVLTDGAWHYITLVVNRSLNLASLYDGGTLAAEVSISAIGSLLTSNTFKIAQDGTGTYSSTFNGNVRQVKFYNVALSESVIKANAFNDAIDSAHPNYSNLVYYIKAIEGTGTTLAPSKGTGNTTLSGTATWIATVGGFYPTASAFWQDIDYGNAPHTYSIAPTLLNWLGTDIPSGYDGTVLAGTSGFAPLMSTATNKLTLNSSNLQSNDVFVFPNPIEGNTININMGTQDNGTYQYHLYNTAGVLIVKDTFVANGNTVAITLTQTLQKGAYVLSIEKGPYKKTFKILKD